MHQIETTSSSLYSMNVLYLSPDKIMRIRNDADPSTFLHYPTLEVKQKRTTQCSWEELLWSTLVTVTLLQVLLTPTSTSTCNSNRIKLWPSSLSWAPSSFQLLSSHTVSYRYLSFVSSSCSGGWGCLQEGTAPHMACQASRRCGAAGRELPNSNAWQNPRLSSPSFQVY